MKNNFIQFSMNTYVIVFVGNQWHCLNVDDENDYQFGERPVSGSGNILVTCQTLELTRVLKDVGKLPKIIDLESLDRQMTQKGKDLRDYREWKFMPFLRRMSDLEDGFVLKDDSIRELLRNLVVAYKNLMLLSESELPRFKTIEMPVNEILFQRQQAGIQVDLEIAKVKCKELESDIYRIKNELQLKHRFFSPDNVSQQISYLDFKKYKIVDSTRNCFRDHRFEDPLCDLFYQMIRSQEDFDSFLFMLSHWGSNGVVHPEYHGFGTITSRITMRQPAIQLIMLCLIY